MTTEEIAKQLEQYEKDHATLNNQLQQVNNAKVELEAKILTFNGAILALRALLPKPEAAVKATDVKPAIKRKKAVTPPTA